MLTQKQLSAGENVVFVLIWDLGSATRGRGGGREGEGGAEKSLAEISVMESPDTDHWLSKGEQERLLHMCCPLQCIID